MRSPVFIAVFCWVALAGCYTVRSVDSTRSMTADDRGALLFQNYCSACHRYDTEGMGEAPPLEGSAWVTGPQRRLIRIALHGVRGPIEVQGKTYNREMPGFGQILSDAEIASLLSFVRRRFGEPSTEIADAAVARVRAESPGRTAYWSVDELLAAP